MHLSDGIQFIVLVIGLFSISEILLMLEQHHSTVAAWATGRALFNLKEMAQTWWSTIRSSLVGFVVGVLPGAGATIASAITYTMESAWPGRQPLRRRRHPRRGGAEAANNASAAARSCPC